MTLAFNTSVKAPKKSIFNTFGITSYIDFCFVPSSKDVIVVNNCHPEFEMDLNEKDLTMQSMNFAVSSFSEEWDKEDNEFWSNY